MVARTAVVVEPEATVAKIQSSTKRAILCLITEVALLKSAILHLLNFSQACRFFYSSPD